MVSRPFVFTPRLEIDFIESGARFALIVHHDDAQREFAYDRQSHIGKLDKAWDETKAKGCTVLSMKNDWKKIFSFEK